MNSPAGDSESPGLPPSAAPPESPSPESPPPESPPPIWAIGPEAHGNGNHAVAGGDPSHDPLPLDWTPVIAEPRTTPREWATEGIVAVVVALGLTGLGAALSYLWSAVSPRVTLEMTADGPVYTQPNPEGYVAGESVYLLLAVGLGVVTAVAAWLLLRRWRGPLVLLGLAVGSVAGAVLMAWLGNRIGLSEYQRLLTDAPVGARFEVPVKVRSAIIDLPHQRVQGAVLIQAMIGVALYTLLAGFYPTASLRPERAVVHFMPPSSEQPADASDGLSSGWPATTDPRAAQAPPAGG